MKPYIGLVSKEAGSAYGIVFPDAPGCFSAADDLDEIFDKASEALAGWTSVMIEDGRPLPPRRDLTALRADPALSELWQDVALVIAVPSEATETGARAA